MTFEMALLQVAQGKKVTRDGWRNVIMYLRVWEALGEQEVSDDGDVFQPIVQVIGFPYTVDGEGHPVTMGPSDMLETDWSVIE